MALHGKLGQPAGKGHMDDSATRPPKGPGPRRAGVAVLLALWLAAFVAALAVRFVVEPTGDGFTRGLNRLGWTVGFQTLALILALWAFSAARLLPRGETLRRWSWGPLILAALFVLAALAPFVLGA
jgi:hypothetical protein